MAPKRPSPLDNPLAASSEEEDQEASSEEGSGSEDSESEASLPPKTTTTSAAKPQQKKPKSAATPQSSSSGETDSGSESDGGNVAMSTAHVKPIASKPMEAATPPPKSRSKPPAASPAPAKSGTKRPPAGESEVKSSKKAKKMGVEQEDSKKSKLFQRIWSDEDEIIILKGMHEHATKKGVDPYSDMAAFHEFIKKSLNVDVSKNQLQDKIRRMKKKFENNLGKKLKSTNAHFELSKKVWGGGDEKAEQPKSNRKAKSGQEVNSKTLASLKADLLASPEHSKAEKSEASLKPRASGSVLNEVIGFDKGFKELGLSETIVMQGLELIGPSKCAELKEKWSELHVAELQLSVRRLQLMRDVAKIILESYKSDN